MRTGMMFDFANPAAWGRPPVELYRRTLEQLVWAEELGLDVAWIPEHHFVDDYVPSPIPVLGNIAARTSRVRLGTGILVGPLYHPVRLAEDIAVLDILSDGRMEVGIGLGWAVREYEAYGVKQTHRVSLTDELVEILRRAWSADALDHQGRRFQIGPVDVLPKPVQRPHPPIWGGVIDPAGVARIVRWRAGLAWLGREVMLAYVNAWEEAGLPPEQARIDGYINLFVCDDPEATWAACKPYFKEQFAVRAKSPSALPGGGQVVRHTPTDEEIDAMRGSEVLVLTPQDAITELRRRADGLPVDGFYCRNSISGMPDDVSDRHVELLMTVVAPALREEPARAPSDELDERRGDAPVRDRASM